MLHKVPALTDLQLETAKKVSMNIIPQMLSLKEWQEFLQMSRKEVLFSLRIQEAESTKIENSSTCLQNYKLRRLTV